MIKSSIEIIAYDIGKDIGHSSNDIQAKLLNGFCHSLGQISSHNRGTQLCYIVDELTPEAKNILKDLVGFIDVE